MQNIATIIDLTCSDKQLIIMYMHMQQWCRRDYYLNKYNEWMKEKINNKLLIIGVNAG